MEQEQFDFLEDIEIDKPDVEFQKWKEQKREAKSRMIAMQYQPYEVKEEVRTPCNRISSGDG